jgi:type I restriction enzyme R subunit
MKPGEHRTVQARILHYAEAIGWTFVSREEAEQRRGFDFEVPPAERAKNRSLFFDGLLDAKVRQFNPRYTEVEGALLGQFRHLHTDIYGNRDFVEHLRNGASFSTRKRTASAI